ncbi:single-stranded DNA-binding protein [Micromonosporaceae bacterium Da 78-11]
MAQGDITITVVGNLVAAPELRFTASGAGVAAFTVVSSPRVLDKTSGEWRDGDPTFLDCKIWRDAAEHVAESLDKGMRVVVTGRLKQESWEDKNGGGKRSKFVLDVEEVGPSLRYATAKVNRVQRSGGGSTGGQRPAPQQSGGDPWSTGASAGPTKTNDFQSEPPF